MYKLSDFLYNSIRGKKRMKKTYTIIVHKEDDIYWGECLELEGCFAQAKSVDELKKLMIESIYLYYSDNEDNKEKVTKADKIELELSYA